MAARPCYTDRVVIRKTLVVFTYYALLPGALGYAIVWSASKGPVNIGSILAAAIVLSAICFIAVGARKARLTADLSTDEPTEN